MATIKMSAEKFLDTDFDDPATLKKLGISNEIAENIDDDNSSKNTPNMPKMEEMPEVEEMPKDSDNHCKE